METLKKNILDIIITEVNSINEKVKGLNFLEILKINLIAKIDNIIPTTSEPVSPIKIEAGLKLNLKKANKDPITANDKIEIQNKDNEEQILLK